MNTENLIYEMLIEDTGKHFLDSGGEAGRNYQRNAGRTIDSFRNEPVERYEQAGGYIERTVSVFHYLNNFGLSIDETCREFNEINTGCRDWDADGDVYGVCKKAWAHLVERHDVRVLRTFNSYNGESDLSQVIQGSHVAIDSEDYMLLQIHGGADVRGGYTNARLFKWDFHDAEYIPEWKSQAEIQDEIESGILEVSKIENFKLNG